VANLKGKVIPVHATKACGEVEVIAPYIFNFGSRGECSVLCPFRFTMGKSAVDTH
jgi:hypothetical protein